MKIYEKDKDGAITLWRGHQWRVFLFAGLVAVKVGGVHKGGSISEKTARHNAIIHAVRAIYDTDHSKDWTPMRGRGHWRTRSGRRH